MQPSRLDKITWIALGIFLAGLAYLLTPTPVERPARGDEWFGAAGNPPILGFVYTLVIDVNRDQSVSEQQVLNGQSYFLAYAPLDEQGNKTVPPIFTFEDMLNLSEFDANQDGYIDASDPDFTDFYVATFNQRAKTLVILPLTAVGIAAFTVYGEQLTMNASQAEPSKTAAGELVLVDNSRWPLQTVPVDIKYFLELATIEWRE